MAQLKSASFKFILCFTAGLLAGVLLGAIILSTLVSYKLDEQYKKITYLENTIQDKDAKLKKFEESINNRSIVLKDIEVELDFDGDEIDKIDIEKAIKEKYTSLLGKEVKSLDEDLIVEVVDKRIFKIEDREFKLQVSRLILTEILRISVIVEEIE